ncbi:hypothetical protein [Streptomyces sp. NPDC088762]|uniref:hypothetical protein n=1 Tax=Streptomyces sp. NPDC088762 TaxID=3365891 RepID=UPI003828675E
MRFRRESIDLPEDRGCLQWVLGVPLGLFYVPAAYFCVLMLIGEVQPGDDRVRAEIESAAHVVFAICVVGLLVSLLPLYRRTMGLWWLLPPVVLGVIAWVRIATLG